MSCNSEDYPESDLTGKIIACAQAVHGELRPGLDEKLYERALCIDFAEAGLHFNQQLKHPVHYKGHFLGNLIPDLIAGSKVIVDAKVIECFTDTHIAQIMGYLNITGLEIGLLINFKHASLQVKRVANLRKNQS